MTEKERDCVIVTDAIEQLGKSSFLSIDESKSGYNNDYPDFILVHVDNSNTELTHDGLVKELEDVMNNIIETHKKLVFNMVHDSLTADVAIARDKE